MEKIRNIVGTCLVALVLVGWFVLLSAFFYNVSGEQTTAREDECVTEVAKNIKYVYEPRTGLCFAFLVQGSEGAMSEVPYEKVKDYLINPPEAPLQPDVGLITPAKAEQDP